MGRIPWVVTMFLAGGCALPSSDGGAGVGTSGSMSSDGAEASADALSEDSAGGSSRGGPDGDSDGQADTSSAGSSGADEGSTGAPPVAPEPGLFIDNELLTPEGVRTYDYYVPVDPGTELLPLVFVLHGHGSSAENVLGRDGAAAPHKVWMDLADAEKFLLAVPNGAVSPDDELGWNDCRGDATTNPDVDDVAFLGALLDTMSELANVDPTRVYATGTSNGGHMSLRLALELSDRIAAVAPVIAGMPAESQCAAADRPMPVLFVPGTDDPVNPHAGGPIWSETSGRGTVLSIAASAEFWAAHNATAMVPEVELRPDLDPDDDSTVEHRRYLGGIDGADVEVLDIIGGGHTEPSVAEQYSAAWLWLVGPQNHDIEMADEVWAFFAGKVLPR